MKVKIINKSKHKEPEYGSDHAAGLDLRANLDNEIILKHLDRYAVPTGIFIEIPEGYEAQIRPRSGLALKYGIGILNSPGTIDADYRGEIKVIMINFSNNDFLIKDGDRICQMVIAKHEKVFWEEVDFLNTTNRGDGGFGHTGV